jgi:exodeoxyribonuclease VII small subunit
MSGWIGEAQMPGFEDDLKKLETVVEQLERGDLTLDDSVKLFEQGMKLSNACKAELDKAEGRIQVLVHGKKGSMQVAEMEAEEEEQEFGLASGEEVEEE